MNFNVITPVKNRASGFINRDVALLILKNCGKAIKKGEKKMKFTLLLCLTLFFIINVVQAEEKIKTTTELDVKVYKRQVEKTETYHPSKERYDTHKQELESAEEQGDYSKFQSKEDAPPPTKHTETKIKEEYDIGYKGVGLKHSIEKTLPEEMTNSDEEFLRELDERD